ncbi:hypothetical protein [Robiginitomaculum antarcticum]|uniref:hypothetical protein n=1 Tax=Robiginitomaculum antarcticum TaxID=437507 RepID=UPI0003A28EE2|nr:hypothetical protein [Robiginitomaculum antarcticum]
MLTNTRQKLSRFRQNGSPLASIVDFVLWALRSVLTPGQRSFWVILLVISAFVATLVFTQYQILAAAGLTAFLFIVLLSLVLSYLRSISRTHTHALGIARLEIGTSLSDIREEQINSALSLETITDNRHAELEDRLNCAITKISQSSEDNAKSLEDELDLVGDRLIDLAGELQSLRVHSSESVSTLANKQDTMDKQLKSLSADVSVSTGKASRSKERFEKVSTDLLSDLASIKSRLDYSGGNEAGTIEYLCDSIDELRRQLLEIKITSSDNA